MLCTYMTGYNRVYVLIEKIIEYGYGSDDYAGLFILNRCTTRYLFIVTYNYVEYNLYRYGMIL